MKEAPHRAVEPHSNANPSSEKQPAESHPQSGPEREETQMKKIVSISSAALAAVLLVVGSVFAQSGVSSLMEDDENANYKPLVFPFGENVDPPANYDTSAASYDALASSDDVPLDDTDGSCWGACQYISSGGTPVAIRCYVPEQSSVLGNVSATGFAYYDSGNANFDDEPNRIIMCKRVPVTDTTYEWVRVGYCDRDSLTVLTVFGMDAASTAARDVMGIVRYQLNDDGSSSTPIVGEDCNFGNFTSVFESGSLNMYGRGYHDEVYGSQYDDAYLEGEYVNGLEGDDEIHLDNDEGGTYGYSIGQGDDGYDEIWGTITADDIYGDDENDAIYGNDGNDTLSGGVGTDGCSGGNGTDTCDCEVEYYCEI